uniref:Uncharacterized protein n=1 Tax=Cucumis melo TaxID=3656 RepID=A0A9I9CR56_CUCME
MAKGTAGIKRKEDTRKWKELNGKHNSQSRPEKSPSTKRKKHRETRNRRGRFQEDEVSVIKIRVSAPFWSVEAIAKLLLFFFPFTARLMKVARGGSTNQIA